MRHGCDISKHQGYVNFKKMQDAGAEFCVIRKQIGLNTDSRFWENWERARKDTPEMKLTIYGVPVYGYDPQAQVDVLKDGLYPEDLDLPPWCDIERRMAGVSRQQAINATLPYMQAVADWDGRRGVVYTAKFVWEDQYSIRPGWIDEWDLAVAHYNKRVQPDYIPVGWEYYEDGQATDRELVWADHQYWADGNYQGFKYGVASHHIDLNWMQDWYWNRHIGTEPEPAEKVRVDVAYDANTTDLYINGVLYG